MLSKLKNKKQKQKRNALAGDNKRGICIYLIIQRPETEREKSRKTGLHGPLTEMRIDG